MQRGCRQSGLQRQQQEQQQVAHQQQALAAGQALPVQMLVQRQQQQQQQVAVQQPHLQLMRQLGGRARRHSSSRCSRSSRRTLRLLQLLQRLPRRQQQQRQQHALLLLPKSKLRMISAGRQQQLRSSAGWKSRWQHVKSLCRRQLASRSRAAKNSRGISQPASLRQNRQQQQLLLHLQRQRGTRRQQQQTSCADPKSRGQQERLSPLPRQHRSRQLRANLVSQGSKASSRASRSAVVGTVALLLSALQGHAAKGSSKKASLLAGASSRRPARASSSKVERQERLLLQQLLHRQSSHSRRQSLQCHLCPRSQHGLHLALVS
jgi:hypothetical protein